MLVEKYSCDCGYVDFQIRQTSIIHGFDVDDKVCGFIRGLEFMDHEVTVSYHDFVCEECQEKKSPDKIREMILGAAEDIVTKYFYYDRKKDEDLPEGVIEDQVKAGVVSVEEIIYRFREKVITHFIDQDDPERVNWFVPRNMIDRPDLPGNEKPQPEWADVVRFKLLEMQIEELINLSVKLKTEAEFEADREKADMFRTRILAFNKIIRILKSECVGPLPEKRPGFVDDLRESIKNKNGE